MSPILKDQDKIYIFKYINYYVLGLKILLSLMLNLLKLVYSRKIENTTLFLIR